MISGPETERVYCTVLRNQMTANDKIYMHVLHCTRVAQWLSGSALDLQSLGRGLDSAGLAESNGSLLTGR